LERRRRRGREGTKDGVTFTLNGDEKKVKKGRGDRQQGSLRETEKIVSNFIL
jgi:hypothetical protein